MKNTTSNISNLLASIQGDCQFKFNSALPVVNEVNVKIWVKLPKSYQEYPDLLSVSSTFSFNIFHLNINASKHGANGQPFKVGQGQGLNSPQPPLAEDSGR